MGLTITQVDAFTDTPFAGNPAAVCVLPAPREDAWMQQVAREMNLSETAFLLKQEDGFQLRWFTPAVEVDLCGHATLASAHVLWSEGYLPVNAIAHFHTRSGLLTAKRTTTSNQTTWIQLDFPTTRCQQVSPPDELLPALGLDSAHTTYIGKSKFDYLIEVDSEGLVRRLQPDYTKLRSLPVRGIIVTSQAQTSGYDFVSRFFAPASGIDEDPVTGSAHCALAPYWGDCLQKTAFLAYQASPRGGVVQVNWQGDRVLLSGQAVTVLRGELFS